MNKVVFGGTTQTGCTPISPASPAVRREHPVHALRPERREEARRPVGLPEPDRAPADARTRPTGFDWRSSSRPRRRRSGSTSSSTRSTARRRLRGERELRHDRCRAPRPAPTPTSRSTDCVATSGSRNYSGYSNPRLDLILANARKATTPKALATLYHVAQQILLDDRPIIFLYHSVRYAAVSTRT